MINWYTAISQQKIFSHLFYLWLHKKHSARQSTKTSFFAIIYIKIIYIVVQFYTLVEVNHQLLIKKKFKATVYYLLWPFKKCFPPNFCLKLLAMPRLISKSALTHSARETSDGWANRTHGRPCFSTKSNFPVLFS